MQNNKINVFVKIIKQTKNKKKKEIRRFKNIERETIPAILYTHKSFL